jgi:hypothetical protein
MISVVGEKVVLHLSFSTTVSQSLSQLNHRYYPITALASTLSIRYTGPQLPQGEADSARALPATSSYSKPKPERSFMVGAG